MFTESPHCNFDISFGWSLADVLDTWDIRFWKQLRWHVLLKVFKKLTYLFIIIIIIGIAYNTSYKAI